MRQVLQAFRRSSRLNKGFTLIELLIVVAIIAILAAIAIPQFGKYRTESAKRACLADVRNALSMCAAALATDPTKTSCEAGTDYPQSTTNAANIEVNVNTSTGEITATGTCSQTAGGVEVTCNSQNGAIECTIGRGK